MFLVSSAEWAVRPIPKFHTGFSRPIIKIFTSIAKGCEATSILLTNILIGGFTKVLTKLPNLDLKNVYSRLTA